MTFFGFISVVFLTINASCLLQQRFEVKADGGLPSYNSVNRILGKIAEFAKIAEKANPDEPPKFYLVIDEINRANIATVFGELIYGLEYRDSKVSTPYEVEDKVSTPVCYPGSNH